MIYKKFRLDINGLRAFALISVVLYHFGVPYVSGGFIGVDVFFVISGFLMTGIVLERVDHKGVLDFYIARFLRIVPALVFAILLLMIFGLFTLSTNEYEALSKNAISSLLFIQIIITQFTLVISTHHQSSTFCFTPGHYQLSGNFISFISHYS